MSRRTSYSPGTFSWAELATSDAEGAKAFYTGLFGWGYDDTPAGHGVTYSMARLGDGYAAALFASDEPPHWNCYVTVASADEVTARVAGLGGTVVSEPFDVLDVGRMSVIADPSGAIVRLWEARRRIGADVVNATGAMTWNDLLTSDPEAAARFYGDLLGWTTMEIPQAGGYRVIRNGERSNGGIMPAPEGTPPAWVPYFGHDDVEGLAAGIGDLGGRVVSGPMRVPAGKAAVLADPQGAVFAAWTGTYED